MKLQSLLEELKEKPEYKLFQEQNPDSFFAAAFLILDFAPNTKGYSERREHGSNEIQLDFFLPQQNRDCSKQIEPQISEGKIAAFSFPFSKPKIHEDKIEQMKHQTTQIKIDIDDLEPKCKELIKTNNSHIQPTKIIAILKDDIWNLTCMDDMLGIVRMKLNAITGELLDFNKGSLMEFASTFRN